ncbi:MAG: glycosyltransferase family 9 protein [Bacteroidetes bacterium]|nr:glycosyltransferase family 9 protein [Bacteroidota bacterium]
MSQRPNILFVKLCCIGDILFLTPAIRSVRQRFPEARITILASTWIKAVVERIPSVDEVIYFDAPLQKIFIWDRFIATVRVTKELRRRRFTAAVTAHRSSFFSVLLAAAGIRRRIGFRGAAMLTDAVPFDDTKHETARYLELTARLTGTSDPGIMELKATEIDLEFREQFFRSGKIGSAVRYIGIFPGGGDNPGTKMHIKRWPGERYAELVRRLYTDAGLVPVFIGSAPDAAVVDPIIAAVEGSVPYLNAVSVPDLGQLHGLLTGCIVMLGGDSGPMHMAAALGIPTVTIFGPSDPRLVAPLGSSHRYIWKQVPCSPCYTPATVKQKKYFNGNEFICTTGTHACIKEVTVDEVYRTIMEVLPVHRSQSEGL